MKQIISFAMASSIAVSLYSQPPGPGPRDPGPRTGPTQSGKPLAGMTAGELQYFQQGLDAFSETDEVVNGLGPRFNLDSCKGCHSQPAVGGTSPAQNPQIPVAHKLGAINRIPPFMRPDGPAFAVRFKQNPDGSPDGGVHNLFVISGRSDTPVGCNIQQEDFSRFQNLSLRIPTPTFGLGLIESIAEDTLRTNLAANANRRGALGIGGRFNTNGNDGTITRFGWKAQNKSILIFAGEAYNVEVGVTNELFPNERETAKACMSKVSPEDHSDLSTGEYADVQKFAFFMRYLAGPPPAASNPATDRGRVLFDATGCTMCHTPALKTDNVYSKSLSQQTANLYSDLAIHRMGVGLADGVTQGAAQSDEWRTAPLWGLGERLFLMHDGRSRDVVDAIRQHDSPGSEARSVVRNFNLLRPDQQQDLVNFLRSL